MMKIAQNAKANGGGKDLSSGLSLRPIYHPCGGGFNEKKD